MQMCATAAAWMPDWLGTKKPPAFWSCSVFNPGFFKTKNFWKENNQPQQLLQLQWGSLLHKQQCTAGNTAASVCITDRPNIIKKRRKKKVRELEIRERMNPEPNSEWFEHNNTTAPGAAGFKVQAPHQRGS